MNKRTFRFLRVAACVAGGYLLAVGCIPDGAFREVAAENIVRTITLFTSTVVSFLFLNFFPTI